MLATDVMMKIDESPKGFVKGGKAHVRLLCGTVLPLETFAQMVEEGWHEC